MLFRSDIPESARKPEADEDEDDEDGEKPKKKKAAAKSKKAADDQPGKFKLEYASSGRSKCKGEYYFCATAVCMSHGTRVRWMRREHRQGLLQTGP